VALSSDRPLSPSLRRAFTWTGVLPLGAFLVAHLGTNSLALLGTARFSSALAKLHRVPALGALEALFVLLPLAFHGLLGGWLVVTGRPLRATSPYSARVRLAMRVAGAGALAFLVLHLPEFRLRAPLDARLEEHELANLLAADLSTTWRGIPWRGMAYLTGAACAVVHFGIGLWGIVASSRLAGANGRVRRTAAWAIAAASLALWVGFANVVVFHATGAPLFGIASLSAEAAEPCPEPTPK
jgi:succinate dehydrogenase / fumarate reductase cytochrome b subunit